MLDYDNERETTSEPNEWTSKKKKDRKEKGKNEGRGDGEGRIREEARR